MATTTSEFMKALVPIDGDDHDASSGLVRPLGMRQVPRVQLEHGTDVIVHVSATAVNRIDCLQRSGKLAAPPGESQIIGVEMSGVVVEVGHDAQQNGVAVGQRVMALLGGGGYGEFVRVHFALLMRVDDDMSLVQAAALPEVWLTAFQALDRLAPLRRIVNERADDTDGASVLISAGGSGVGTALIQLAKSMGAAKVITTSSEGKRALCLELGADVAIDRRADDGQWQKRVLEETNGRGADIVIDFVGGPYWRQNLDAVAPDGYIVVLGFLGGFVVADDPSSPHSLAPILRKRITIVGSTLRTRPLAYKRSLTADFWQYAQSKFANNSLKPVIDNVLPIDEASRAHEIVEANENSGKIVLQWD